MDSLREDSLLFSLKNLQEAEQRRIAEEAADRTKRIEEAERQRLLEEVKREDAERRRKQAEADAARFAAERERTEKARFEAMKQAEIERVRTEAKIKGQIAIERARQEYEAGIEREKSRGAAKRWKIGSGVLGALLTATLAGACGLYFGQLKPNQERKLATAQATAVSERESADRAERMLEAERGKTSKLTRENTQLTKERDDVKQLLDRAMKQLGDRGAKKVRVSAPVAAGAAAPGGVVTPRKECKDTGDPMDFCL